jgi:ferric-dicitrate binding protein FerR (iron transport regulator)
MQDASGAFGSDRAPQVSKDYNDGLVVVEPDEAAARWLVGLTAGTCTDEFLEAFEMWVSCHPANERAFEEMCCLWLKLGVPLMADWARRGPVGALIAPATGETESRAERKK